MFKGQILTLIDRKTRRMLKDRVHLLGRFSKQELGVRKLGHVR